MALRFFQPQLIKSTLPVQRIGLAKLMKKSKLKRFGEIVKNSTSDPCFFYGELSYNIAGKVTLKFESILIIFYLVKLSSKLENRTQ